MTVKYLLSIFITFSFSLSMAEDKKIPDYNRAECDALIDVKRFIHSGSLDDSSPGGKVYRFDSIVNSISSELLGGEAPNKKKFECLNNLFFKAKTDAAQYWGQRGANEGCLNSDGSVPNVKPESCAQKTWDYFKSSVDLIERSDVAVNELVNKCVEKDGKKSCDAMASLRDIEENIVGPATATKMDECCNMKKGEQGPAFRVLRSFYTVEFGRHTDAELQKECYKRTRPDNSGALSKTVSGAWQCMKSIVTGVIESVMKTLRTIGSLFDLTFWGEVVKILSKPQDIPAKIGAFFQGMWNQITAQASAATGCFSGPYAADQVCKLMASLATDFATPAFIIKYVVPMLKAPISVAGKMGQQFLKENPGAKAKLAKVAEVTKNTGSAVSRAVKAPLSLMSSAARAMANRLAAMNRGFGNIKNKIKEVGKQTIDNSRDAVVRGVGGKTAEGTPRYVRAGDKPSGPNAATEVPVPAAPAAPVLAAAETVGTSSAANLAATASRNSAIGKSIPKNLSPAQAAKMESALEKTGLNIRANGKVKMYQPETALYTSSRKLNGSTIERKRSILEGGAERRRVEVTRLEKNGNITKDQAAIYRQNIDEALNQAKQKFGVTETPKPTVVASAATPEGKPASNWPQQGDSLPPAVTVPPATAGASSTSNLGVVGSQVDNLPRSATTVAEFKPFFENPSISSFVQAPTVVKKGASTAYDSTVKFSQNVQGAFANGGANLSPAAMRQAAYGGTNSYWSISRQTVRQHNHVDDLLARGQINANLAKDLHHMIESAERIASNMGKPTWYANGTRVTPPNANPSMFTRLSDKNTMTKKDKVVVATAGAAMSSRQFSRYSDGGSLGNKYDDDTVTQAGIVVDKISATPTGVKDEFADLTTEEAIHDKADELRTKIKVLEASLGRWRKDDEAKLLTDLLASVQNERNRALNKIGKPVPADEPEAAAAPTNGSGSSQADAAAAAEAASAAPPVVAPQQQPPAKPAAPAREPARKAAPPAAAPAEQAEPENSGADGDGYEAVEP